MKNENSWLTNKNEDKEIDVVINKNIELSSAVEKIRLRLENKLRLFYKEWFLHEEEGMYWIKREQNNGQIGNILERFNIETQIRETILNDKDVLEIETFENKFENTSGKYDFNIVIILKNGEKLKL